MVSSFCCAATITPDCNLPSGYYDLTMSLFFAAKTRFLKFLPALFTALFLTACAGLPIEKAALKEPLPAPENAQPSPIGFREVRWAVPTGTPVLSQSPRGLLGLLNCDWPYGQVEQGITSRRLPSNQFKDIFLHTMEGQGYDVTGDPGRFFDEFEDMQRTIYAIGARIVDIKADICARSNIWGVRRGDKGEAALEIEWTVYDMIRRKTVYKTATKGHAALKTPNMEGLDLMVEQAFAHAAHNLGSDRDFHDLVFFGTPTDYADPKGIMDIDEMPVMKFDPQEDVTLPPQTLSDVPVKNNLEHAKNATVLIQTAGTHGSGFFITGKGHILTNAHVVGNAVRARVVTSGKREKLVAEVLRIDRHRDIALLRLEEIPAGFEIVTLPLKLEKPEIGEDVYAIGAPKLTKLQDTVTHGIVSANRYDRRKKLWFIQADVDIYGGNSGGPLLDEYGNIIGVSVSGFFVAADTFGGLNWFIPIENALEKLDIAIAENNSGRPVDLTGK